MLFFHILWQIFSQPLHNSHILHIKVISFYLHLNNSINVGISRFPIEEEGPAAFSEGLWRRAVAAGAFMPMEKRTFGIADDM